VTLALAEISSKQDYALGVTEGDGKLVLVTFGESDQPSSLQTIESIGRGASHITLSSEGKSAAVLFPEGQSLQILSGLPEKPHLAGGVDLRLTGLPEALALDDEGQLIVLSVSETQEVVLIRDVLGAAQRIRIAAKEDGIHDPVAVEFAKNQRRVFVANAASGSVASLSLDGEPATLTFFDCTPSALGKLDGDGVFRLTEISEKPLLMVEATGTEIRVLFVPYSSAQTNRAERERRANLPVSARRSRLP
jgi:hypothetical protein